MLPTVFPEDLEEKDVEDALAELAEAACLLTGNQ